HYFFSYYFKELLIKFNFIKFLKEITAYRKNHKSLFSINFLLFLMMPYSMKKKITFKKRNYLRKEFLNKFKKRKTKIRQWNSTSLNQALINSVVYYSLPHLLRTEDKSSMRFSIESRVPFLDYELVEYVLSSKPDFKIRNGITKYSFRQAMKGITPKEILSRMDKIGFATPEETWLVDEKVRKIFFKIINSQSFKNRKYWNADKIKELYLKHLKKQGNYANEIWKCICLEKWFEIFGVEE
ncbi:MAG: asparagine synthase C-terminal domain-containing protein, partial [Candidatus Woesearchaeota archaeon]